jgi:Regulator of ribonuclease activity B
MDETPNFPDDEIGRILRRMYDAGDDVTRSRIVDFCFIFADRERALAFVRDVSDEDVEICLSWYREKAVWQVIVKHDVLPEHATIAALEAVLTSKAQKVEGMPDGWGCLVIPRK